MPESDPAILLRGVDFSYDGGNRVLKKISLEVAGGERVFILGRNGSGKSTLVKILGALQSPSQGACFICGIDASDAAVHGKVSVVFQNPESQIVGAVVEDDVAFAPENQGLPSPEIEKRVSWALEKVGLLHKRSALSSALSGGEKQRLALAGALAAGSVCLILDEPVAMLDSEGRVEVENVLRDIHASGTTIVQVTHRLEDVFEADRVLVLSRGMWAWQGRGEDFWDVAESLGFELPPLVVLGRRLSRKGVPLSLCHRSSQTFAQNVVHAILDSLSPPGQGGVDEPPRSPRSSEREEAADAGPPPSPFFEVRRLHYSFNVSTPLETKVLSDVSCIVPAGTWLSVLGRTGSGKSTLIQHLNGICRIQSGEILIGGQALPQSGSELRDLRRRVGLVFQSPEVQLFSPTVREELAFAPKNWGCPEEEIDARVERALESVGLDMGYLERNPLLLSGGERRLVAIASILSADPGCLVLDEPTAGLDASFRKRIKELLQGLRRAGKTVVTVTHDLDMALEHSDRLLVLDRGVRMCEGSIRATLPALLEMEASMLPEILQVSGMLWRHGVKAPLTWNVEELCRGLGL
jgi:energy-coupling factor transport system ATP-binding protein